MSDTKVGILIPETAQRDAIHMAVAPVIVDGSYSPGARVGFMPDGRFREIRQAGCKVWMGRNNVSIV